MLEGILEAGGKLVIDALVREGIAKVEQLLQSGIEYVYKNKDRYLSEASTLQLTFDLAKELKNGGDLAALIQQRVPGSDPDVVRAETKALLRGIHDTYDALADEIDDAWIEQHLNRALYKLNLTERVRYLRKLISLFPQELVSPDSAARMEHISEDGASEADVAFLIETARKCINQDASVMVTNTVRAAETNLGKLSQGFVDDLSECGEITAMAYAAARYILHLSGKKLWNKHTPAEENDAYSIGVTAAANVEKDFFIAAYNKGKMLLDELKTMIARIAKAVWSLVSLPFAEASSVLHTENAIEATPTEAFSEMNEIAGLDDVELDFDEMDFDKPDLPEIELAKPDLFEPDFDEAEAGEDEEGEVESQY